MRTNEQKAHDREKRTNIISLFICCFAMLIIICLIMIGFTGGNLELDNIAHVIISEIKTEFDKVWFKISGFLEFLAS